MARSNGPEVYRGRRKRLNVLGVVFGALAALILLTVTLYLGLQLTYSATVTHMAPHAVLIEEPDNGHPENQYDHILQG